MTLSLSLSLSLLLLLLLLLLLSLLLSLLLQSDSKKQSFLSVYVGYFFFSIFLDYENNDDDQVKILTCYG